MRWRFSLISAAPLALAALAALVGTARADDAPNAGEPTAAPEPSAAPASPPAPAAAPAPAPAPKPKSGVYWHEGWSRFFVGEGIVAAAVTLRNNDLGAALDGPNEPTIKGTVPVLDRGLATLFRSKSPAGLKASARMSDLGFRTLVIAPYVSDVIFGALILHQNVDIAAQLALIDFEVLTLAGMTQLLGSRIIGRARPITEHCPEEGCGSGPYRSFLSGHAMASFTAAGLICRHHAELPLFGGGAIDTWACVWALTAASATGTLRLVADQHWASDVILGGATGWMFGYYLPKLLHFHSKKVVAKTAADGKPPVITWLPTLTGTTDGGMLGIAGMF